MNSVTVISLVAILMVSIVVIPAHAATTPSFSIKAANDYLKTLKVPSSTSGGYHAHNTGFKFTTTNPGTTSTTANQNSGQQKAQGNYVAGQPWGTSTSLATQATQGQNTQNSHQATNAHQATQYQMPNTGIHKGTTTTTGKLQLPKSSGSTPKLP